ncbi:hypothetical protein IW146_002440 [Coemansia sp. RSA 922]|nr:hypothetical protein GGI14_003268 [Coemansia sp. S680]KAJ2052314.1 hypothetical protein H4S04_001426 [Coemansia sp. S16]KAJ2115264.1 hypothetical protein IW146_002440 [Coemansia sp. RSA 922]
MFNRLATRTARTVGVSHRVAHRLIAPYSSDSIPPPAPPSGAPGNSPNKDKKEAPLSSLLDMLSTQRPGTPVTKMPKFSQMLNSDKPVKGDFSGFIGSGMYGGRLAKEEAEDPMSLLILHVHASSNNTILSLTDANGKVIVNASGGTVGFKKAQRAGFEAAYQATASIAATVKERGINVKAVELRLKGFGTGREAAFKAVHSVTNWVVMRIVDTTPIPFNGCRPRKARRL